ncbi:MAG: UvrB/UvrC motif-containing protein [Chloroflexi bacterium]|nr:UvrB/UvrC motif-containing protein [Chloroflexota bacterium]
MRLPFPRRRSEPPRSNHGRFDRYTERARRVLTLAQEESYRLGHDRIGAEHLLLGLVREHDGVAARVLVNLGVEPKKLSEAVEFLTGRGNGTPLGEIPLTPEAKKAIELAFDEARRQNHHYIGTEHLLLGILRENAGIAAGVLGALGVNIDVLRVEVVRVLTQPMSQQPDPLDQPASGDSQEILDALRELARTIQAKDKAIAVQDYERAAMLRDRELKLRMEIQWMRHVR